jgi:hypothetical protein
MERKKNRSRGVTRLSKGGAKSASRLRLATSTEVQNYRCALRHLPARVYSAILTAIWETLPAPQRTELVR